MVDSVLPCADQRDATAEAEIRTAAEGSPGTRIFDLPRSWSVSFTSTSQGLVVSLWGSPASIHRPKNAELHEDRLRTPPRP